MYLFSPTNPPDTEAGSGSRSHECLLSAVGRDRGERMCQSTLESGGQNPIPSTSSESGPSLDSASMEDIGMVPHSPGDAGGLSHHATSSGRSDITNYTTNGTRGGTSTSHQAYLKQQYRDEQISNAGTELLLASWRTKSSKSYDSSFGKWGVLLSPKWCGSHFGPYK